jgi:xylose isomerase
MKQRIARLPHEKILECHMDPSRHRGELEEILIQNL